MANKCTCCAPDDASDRERLERLHKIIEKNKTTRGALITVLHEAQEVYGYLPMNVQLEIADGLGLPLAEVYGVVSFYTQFSITPKGKYCISVCMGTACYVKGSQNILDKFKTRLSIDIGECTEDGKFSLEACRCIGSCGLAPVIKVNDDVYGKLTVEEVDQIIDKYEAL